MINLIHGDCLVEMANIPDGSVDMVISSPPYNLDKEYEEKTSISSYLLFQSKIINDYFRVIKDGGSICYNVGSYVKNGAVYPIDCLLFNIFIQAGFTPRNRIIWTFGHGLHCKNRLSGRHESILWFTKGSVKTFNLDEIRVPQKFPNKRYYKGAKKGELSGNPLGKNPGDVWDICNVKNNHPEKTSHPCQFPEKIPSTLIKALTNELSIVMDPFMGSGTTGAVCKTLNRRFIGIELDAHYFEIAKNRIEAA